MFTAVRHRDISKLRSLLLHAETNYAGGGTPGHHAPGAGSGSLGKQNGFKLMKQPVVDVNSRDHEGNTALHIAVSLGHQELVEALVQCSKVNVNAQDTESGYTPLHKAAFDGNLSLALAILRLRPDCDLSLRDREGNTCMDLLMSTIELPTGQLEQELVNDEDEEESIAAPVTESLDPATAYWTWGSNTNYVLGHQNSDDRAFPEQVDVTFMTKKQAPTVSASSFPTHEPLLQSATLSKYHGAILTTDNLFMNGFGSGGRLGLGNEETVLRPTVVSGIKGKVTSIALGTEHSIAVTAAGGVWTWGSNKSGQLGYPSHIGLDENPFEPFPREVGGVINKIRILGAAASRHHSAVFSDTGTLYTWGLNVGQLGYQQPDNTIQMHPKKITDFPQIGIRQICATKNATAVLTGMHDVFVFAEFKFTRVTFMFQQFPKNILIHHPRSERPPLISRVVSGNHQFAALTTTGDVFMWSPPEAEFANTWQQQNFPQRRPKKVWAVKKKHLAARDVAIGIDSSLIIRTDSGHVYVGVRRKQEKLKPANPTKADDDAARDVIFFKYQKIPHLQHVQHVTASASGAFGALRLDRRPPSIAIPDNTLREDIGQSLKRLRETDEYGCSDVVFVCRNSVRLRAHRIILACRSAMFRRLFCEHEIQSGNQKAIPDCIVMRHGDGLPGNLHEIVCSSWHSDSVSLVLDYIYTSGFQKGWDHSIFMRFPGKHSWGRGSSSDVKLTDTLDCPASISPENLYAEFNTIIKACELGDVVGANPKHGTLFHSEVLSIHTQPQLYAPLADTVLRGSDGDLDAHQMILRERCSFFAATMGGHWSYSRDAQHKRIVSLPHVRVEVLRIVLRFLHGSCGDDVFDGVEKPGVDAFLAFVVEVLACADELMLDGLKKACQAIILRGLCVTNVVNFLEVSDWYGCEALKNRCLEFVCWNLEMVIESRMLDGLTEELVNDIQLHIWDLQTRKFPYTRGKESPYMRARATVLRDEEDRKQKRRLDYERTRERGTELVDVGLGSESPGSLISPILRPGSGGDSASDGMFELELDDIPSNEPMLVIPKQAPSRLAPNSSTLTESSSPGKGKRGGKRNWTKVSLEKPPASPTATSFASAGAHAGTNGSTNKSWGPVIAPKDATKVSLKDIMNEAERPRPVTAVNPMVANERRKSVAECGAESRGLTCPSAMQKPAPTNAIATCVGNHHKSSSKDGNVYSPKKTLPVSPMLMPQQSVSPLPPPSPLTLAIRSSVKMSQKERRRSAAAAAGKLSMASSPSISANGELRSVWSPTTTTSTKSALPPQKFSVLHGAQLSLRDIMQAEADHRGEQQVPAVRSFAAIQAEQHSSQQARVKLLKRPLERIQVEERAIAQLQEFYGMTRESGSGEWIVVDRGGLTVLLPVTRHT
ncbi:hypothetical protein DFJ77DRAFT_527493 [Powellomyces hirtus]|nr:hypothetical protein DFJ77DRAFT_527493 [Powellomyces hirtus]